MDGIVAMLAPKRVNWYNEKDKNAIHVIFHIKGIEP